MMSLLYCRVFHMSRSNKSFHRQLSISLLAKTSGCPIYLILFSYIFLGHCDKDLSQLTIQYREVFTVIRDLKKITLCSGCFLAYSFTTFIPVAIEDQCNTTCGFWELNPSLSQEQQALLTTKPSLPQIRNFQKSQCKCYISI